MSQNNERITPLIEYFAESTTACLVTMVQGNLLALTIGHLAIASQTGIIAGTVAAVALFFAKTERRWIVALLLGTATAVVDYFVHPGMFGPVMLEAIVTGVAAGVLSFLAGVAVRAFGLRRGRATR